MNAPSKESSTTDASPSSRFTVVLYGVAVYVMFLVTFLYAACFIGGFWVPTSLDAEATTSLWKALGINAALLALFAVQHNVMARRWFKQRWTRFVHPAAERATFVLATNLVLILIFVFWKAPPGDVVWHVEHPIAANAIWGLFTLGWVIVLVSTFLIDHFDLFGLAQVIRFGRGQQYEPPSFRVRTWYRYVRHPLYLGFFIAMWATPHMTWSHALFAGGCTAFMLWSIPLEERDLVHAHGEDYRDYQKRVPMMFPAPWRRW